MLNSLLGWVSVCNNRNLSKITMLTATVKQPLTSQNIQCVRSLFINFDILQEKSFQDIKGSLGPWTI